ncbi:MAG: nucleotidyltransferase family protein [Bacteroidetes bacterium]|nr:nucleotidyltransferase family protein [Bacteroidota bacterium]
MTSENIDKKPKEIKPYLIYRFQISQIGYFGSFAQNRQNDDSDIDILVEFSKIPGWEFFTLEEYLEGIFKREIDLVTKSALRDQMRDTILSQVKYVD